MQVRAPRVQPPSFPVDDQDVSLVWDWYGTVYGRASDLAGNGHMPTHGGRVHHVASCETLSGEQLALRFVAVPDDVRKIWADAEELFTMMP